MLWLSHLKHLVKLVWMLQNGVTRRLASMAASAGTGRAFIQWIERSLKKALYILSITRKGMQECVLKFFSLFSPSVYLRFEYNIDLLKETIRLEERKKKRKKQNSY